MSERHWHAGLETTEVLSDVLIVLSPEVAALIRVLAIEKGFEDEEFKSVLQPDGSYHIGAGETTSFRIELR